MQAEGRHEVTRRWATVTSLAVALTTFALAAQTPAPSDPHDPAPWTCSPIDKTHRCQCHRMDDDPMCEGTVYHEDKACKRYCVPDKCRCPVHCPKES